ncbi:putative mitochondrial hypothetical protein [Leptomonas pyrrhocoris]|uniref:Uncharacterized protein n=1 Tax=Leptomonas pyrrhocoris TaxID=157538 RepID=A0A0M9FPA4_LEPPY|nr:putative mitochondrial hypothetical protein [Leptomonas pyrrhocoris]KPA73310.1 putative mitochondrial hypothetical protein [Leptomonas pyrrhocoris]|eukprot:XP_015651749.1 putative mitochondrial hypothetical protein [Leptomonas pyrrhocoris]
MPPRAATRTARLRQPRLTAHVERMRLLTYPMALAQQGATVPLIHSHKSSNSGTASAGQRPPPAPPSSIPPMMGREGSAMDDPYHKEGATSDDTHNHTLPVPRRWVRDADELCIASIHRSNNINRINSYVATYKFEDPQWAPLLLPEVHVLPKPRASAAPDQGKVETAAEPTTSSPPPPSCTSSPDSAQEFDVFIDYNKLTTLELISRHANYALRHLVQKGHAMYLINFAQHSITQMRGLVEASYVSCAYGIRGERLRTHIIHTGPVDVRDVMEIDPATQRVSFNRKKPHVRRGVVAVSTVEGYGTWFQRKPMLWQRTRRIGALQSQMGSYDYQLCDPAEVGRLRSYEVALLAPHVRLIGAQGGAEAVALVASSQVAQNERLYMGQFEAPVLTAVDAVQQLAHRTALHHQLVRPAAGEAEGTTPPTTAAAAAAAGHDDPQSQERRRLAGMERLLPVSWVTRTPPPYVPLEADLPFRIQMSRPAVIRTDRQTGQGAAAAAFPTGGAVGSPFVKGVPLSLFEYNIHQGVDHYVFDDAPSARPLKWWNQKSNMPYNGYLYAMRSGLLDHVEPAGRIANPLAPPSSSKARSSVRSAKRRRRRQTRGRCSAEKGVESVMERGDDAAHASPVSTPEVNSSTAEQAEGDEAAHLTSMELHLAGEVLPAGADVLAGHDNDARQAAALQWSEDGSDVAVSDRPPLHTLVEPNSAAQRRLRRYAKRAAAATSTAHRTAGVSAAAGAAAMPLEERADALLRRQLRLRRLQQKDTRKGHGEAVAASTTPASSNGGADTV